MVVGCRSGGGGGAAAAAGGWSRGNYEACFWIVRSTDGNGTNRFAIRWLHGVVAAEEC